MDESSKRESDGEYEEETQKDRETFPRPALKSQSLEMKVHPKRFETIDPKSLERRRGKPRQHTKEVWLTRKNSLLHRSTHVNADQLYEILIESEDATQEETKQTLQGVMKNLTLKRTVLQRLYSSKEWRRKKEKVPAFAALRYSISKKWKKLKYDVHDIAFSCEFWYSHLKTIQGHFGTGVASYFYFLRWLFLLNVVSFLILLCFIIIPQAIFPPCSDNSEVNETFTGMELLTGEGYFTDSLMYYGYYANETLSEDKLPYDMPAAYLLSMAAFFLLWLTSSAYSLAHAYKENFIERFGRTRNVFSNKVFCSWDYTIETVLAAKLKSRSIYNDLLEKLSHQKKLPKAEAEKTLCLHIVKRIAINLFVLSTMAGIGYLVHYLIKIKALQTDIQVLGKMTVSLTITTIIFVVPVIYMYLSKFEVKDKLVQLYLTIIRIVLLEVVILGILVYFWFVPKRTDEVHLACFETSLGQEVYRLLIVDFFFILIFQVLFGEIIRRCIHNYYPNLISNPEFHIAWNTLSLIYTQTLSWVGTFYSPMLPLVTLIKLYIIFYVKRISIFFNCKPSHKPWHASHIRTVFLGLSFGNFILALIAVTHSVFNNKPSRICGSFRHLETRYDSIINLLGDGLIKRYALAPGVVTVVFILFSLMVYYMRIKAKARQEMMTLLKEHLAVEGKDKIFLLKLIKQTTQQKLREHEGRRNEPDSNFKRHSTGGQSSHKEIINQSYEESSLNRNGIVEMHAYPLNQSSIYMTPDAVSVSSVEPIDSNFRHRFTTNNQ